jgi:hypothetical protein
MLITSLDRESFSTTDVLDLYRLRWRIELAFKRVNRRANGTPDRRRKGTPLRHDDTIKPGARFALVVA